VLDAGAEPGFAGLMFDRRYDRGGELQARDEVLRLRVHRAEDGSETSQLGWKGPTTLTPEGYKGRRELEYALTGSQPPEALLGALGYQEVHRIDRYVEYYRLGSATLRLEWFPRMDVLLEVEGDGAGIEEALRVSGLPRSDFSASSLAGFVTSYTARTGLPALLALAPDGPPPSWESR